MTVVRSKKCLQPMILLHHDTLESLLELLPDWTGKGSGSHDCRGGANVSERFLSITAQPHLLETATVA